MISENERPATNDVQRVETDIAEKRSLGTDLAQTAAQTTLGGAGGYLGAAGANKVVGLIGDALKGEPEPPSQVVLPPGVEKE